MSDRHRAWTVARARARARGGDFNSVTARFSEVRPRRFFEVRRRRFFGRVRLIYPPYSPFFCPLQLLTTSRVVQTPQSIQP